MSQSTQITQSPWDALKEDEREAVSIKAISLKTLIKTVSWMSLPSSFSDFVNAIHEALDNMKYTLWMYHVLIHDDLFDFSSNVEKTEENNDQVYIIRNGQITLGIELDEYDFGVEIRGVSFISTCKDYEKLMEYEPCGVLVITKIGDVIVSFKGKGDYKPRE
jgi:hypothetical protein